MKKIGVLILILCFSTLGWYLFIKEYDYMITFKVNMAPGSIYNKLKNLGSDVDGRMIYGDNTIFESIKQEIKVEDDEVVLDWHFNSVADTITKVSVGIMSQNNTIQNRLQVLTGTSKTVKEVKSDLIDFRNVIKQYTDRFKVLTNGISTTPAMRVLSVSSQTKRSRKASEMIRLNGEFYAKISDSLKIGSYPILKITNWDIKTDAIDIDFGFPIIRKETLPNPLGTKYINIDSRKALKATYYGNYRNSDEAWFVLLEYAKKHNIIIEEKPLEIFYNNPMQGGDELAWKAEIFLPIID